MTFLELVRDYRFHIALAVFALIVLRISIVYRNRLFGPKSKLIKHNEYMLDHDIEVFLVSIKGKRQELGHLFHLLRLYNLNFVTHAELVLLSRRRDLPRGMTIVTIPLDTAFMMHTDLRAPHAIVEANLMTLAKGDQFLRFAVTIQVTAGKKKKLSRKDFVGEPSSTPA